jgi:hypothetical protein
MSITVHANPDGTYKVTCGNQSVIVGVPTAPAASPPTSAQPRSPADPFTPPTHGTLGGVGAAVAGGVTAEIFPTGLPQGHADAPTFVTVEDYAQALNERRLRSPTTVRFTPHPGTAIDLSAFEQVTRGAGFKEAPKLEIVHRSLTRK